MGDNLRCTDVCDEVVSMLTGAGFDLDRDYEGHSDMLEALDVVTLTVTPEALQARRARWGKIYLEG